MQSPHHSIQNLKVLHDRPLVIKGVTSPFLMAKQKGNCGSCKPYLNVELFHPTYNMVFRGPPCYLTDFFLDHTSQVMEKAPSVDGRHPGNSPYLGGV